MKVPKKVQEIRDYKLKQESGAKNISFSQLSVYLNCPKCWERAYLRKEQVYEPNIHTAFGTAFHKTLQDWLDIVYNKSVKEANEVNLSEQLEQNLRSTYIAEKGKFGKHFSTGEELAEFCKDGEAILEYIKKHRTALFPTTKTGWLVGCEIPIYVKLQEKFYFKGFIDILTYDEKNSKWKIWDIKTSTRGWSDEKNDSVKTSQLLLYKEFLHRQFNIPLEDIEIEYFIVKRKILEESEFAGAKKRVQEFIPREGPRIQKKVIDRLNDFIKETLTESGDYIDKSYPENPSTKNCKWCIFRDTCKARML